MVVHVLPGVGGRGVAVVSLMPGNTVAVNVPLLPNGAVVVTGPAGSDELPEIHD